MQSLAQRRRRSLHEAHGEAPAAIFNFLCVEEEEEVVCSAVAGTDLKLKEVGIFISQSIYAIF